MPRPTAAGPAAERRASGPTSARCFPDCSTGACAVHEPAPIFAPYFHFVCSREVPFPAHWLGLRGMFLGIPLAKSSVERSLKPHFLVRPSNFFFGPERAERQPTPRQTPFWLTFPKVKGCMEPLALIFQFLQVAKFYQFG